MSPSLSIADDEVLKPYTGTQEYVYEVLEGTPVKAGMGLVILLNAIQVVYESDVGSLCKFEKSQSHCDEEEGWLLVTNWMFLVLYTVELTFRVYVHRLRCLREAWDIFDALIIFSGIVSEVFGGVLPSTGILRLARLARLARAMRFLPLPKEVHIMIHGFVSALFAISIGCFLVFLMLTLWSVVAVALLNEPNHDAELLAYYERVGCEWGPKAWSSISNAIFTFAQLLIMGEGWGCNAIPLIERNWWALMMFMCVFFTVVLGMTNLILAVIVDKALQAHEDNTRMAAAKKTEEKTAAIDKFIALCREMDADGSGSLTLDEMMKGYRSMQDFRDSLRILDIAGEDLELLYHMMDKDRSGDVSYDEFGQQLARMKNENIQTMLSFTKHHVIESQIVINALYSSVTGMRSESLIRQASEGFESQEGPASPVPTTPVSKMAMPPVAQDLRQVLQGRALEACCLLTEKVSDIADGERLALCTAVAALQAKLQDPPRSDLRGQTQIFNDINLKAIEPKLAFDPEVAIFNPLLDELKRVEERLAGEIRIMVGKLQHDISYTARIDPVARGSCKYLCLPDALVSSIGNESGAPGFRRV